MGDIWVDGVTPGNEDHTDIKQYFDGVFLPNADGTGGLVVTKVEDEKLTAEMAVEARHLNYMGGLHGGVSATVGRRI